MMGEPRTLYRAKSVVSNGKPVPWMLACGLCGGDHYAEDCPNTPKPATVLPSKGAVIMKDFTLVSDPEAEEFKDPKHYTSLPSEPVYFIEANKLSFMEGCIIKYVCRWKNKDGIRDLKKARRYLDMLIKQSEGVVKYAE